MKNLSLMLRGNLEYLWYLWKWLVGVF